MTKLILTFQVSNNVIFCHINFNVKLMLIKLAIVAVFTPLKTILTIIIIIALLSDLRNVDYHVEF